MNTAVIITKTEPEVKKKAQKIAKEIGVSLSSLVHAYLKQLIRTRRVEFDLEGEPSDYLIRTIRKAEEDIRKGNISPAFKSGKEAVEWLEKQGI